jgi:hypothetical protein
MDIDRFSNPAASGNGAVTVLFQAGFSYRAVPEPQRYAGAA